MEKEVSSAVSLAVTLIALASVLGLVVYTVHMGQDLKVDVYDKGNRIEQDIGVGYLQDLTVSEKKMPMAAAYSLFRQYGKYIPEMTCGVCGKTTDLTVKTPCFTNHLGGMQGQVYVKTTETTPGVYKVEVRR